MLESWIIVKSISLSKATLISVGLVIVELMVLSLIFPWWC